MDEITSIQTVSSLFGISQGTFGWLLAFGIVMSIGIVVFRMTGSLTATMAVQFMGLGVLAMMGMIPMWILVVFGFLTVPVVSYRIFGAERNSAKEGGTSNEHHGGMNVAALIVVAIAIVVGVVLIPGITSSISQVTDTTAASGQPISVATGTLMNVLPIVFATIIIMGAVSWIGFSGGEKKEKSVTIKLVRNPKSLIQQVVAAADSLDMYIRNLDAYLGIKTTEDSNPGSDYGLSLTRENELYIDPRYDWYLAAKEEDRDMFKVIGLHKEDMTKNRVYILGVKADGPCLYELPTEYVEKVEVTPWETVNA